MATLTWYPATVDQRYERCGGFRNKDRWPYVEACPEPVTVQLAQADQEAYADQLDALSIRPPWLCANHRAVVDAELA